MKKLSELKDICEKASKVDEEIILKNTPLADFIMEFPPKKVSELLALLEEAEAYLILRSRTNEGLWSGEIAWLKKFNERFG